MGGSKVDSAFHPSEVDKVSIRNFCDLVVKSKLPPRSGSSLEAVEPPPIKMDHKVFVFFNNKRIVAEASFKSFYQKLSPKDLIQNSFKKSCHKNLV